MRIVADMDIPYLQGVFEPHVQDVRYVKGNEITPKHVKNVDVLIVRTRTHCNEDLLKNSSVKVIATATIGTDHIDLEYCKNHGIKVYSAPGCNAGAVVQWVISAIFSLLPNPTFHSLKDLTLGIIGVGNIGRLLTTTAKSLGINVLQFDLPRSDLEGHQLFSSLEELAQTSDVVSLHIPLNQNGRYRTYQMIGHEFFSKMKKGAILLNSSRGGVVDENELLSWLKIKELKVALDVWENEPKISSSLLSEIPIATPHIAGYSLEGKINATRMVVQSVANHFNIEIDSSQIAQEELSVSRTIELDNFMVNDKFLFSNLFLEIYNIEKDSRALKKNPTHFEELRNSYNFRREFSAYKLKEGVVKVGNIDWGKLGFTVVSNQ